MPRVSERAGSDDAGQHSAQRPRSGCTRDATCPRPGPPAALRRRRPRRRTVLGPGRPLRRLAAGRARPPDWMSPGPGGDQLTAGFDVHQDSAVVAALAGCVLVDADHPRRRHFRLGKRVDQAQDRAPAHGHAEDGGQPGAGPAGQGETECGQGRAQSFRALTVSAGQAGYLLHEGPARAHGFPAPEPPDAKLQHNPSPGARHVGGKTQVGTMNAGRPGPTLRAGAASRGALPINTHHRDVHVHRQHRDVRDRREQQLLQTEHDFFHGPELSAQLP